MTVSITDCPNYQNLTADDIYVITTRMQAHYSGDGTIRNAYAPVTWTYDSNNGIVTISSYGSASGCQVAAIEGKVIVL